MWFSSRTRVLVAMDAILAAAATGGAAVGLTKAELVTRGAAQGSSPLAWPWGGDWRVECAILHAGAAHSGSSTGAEADGLVWHAGWLAADTLNGYIAGRKPWVSHAQIDVQCPDMALAHPAVATGATTAAGLARSAGDRPEVVATAMIRLVAPQDGGKKKREPLRIVSRPFAI